MIVAKKTRRSESKSSSSQRRRKLRKQQAPTVRPTLAGSPEEVVIALLPTLNYSEIKDLCATHTNFSLPFFSLKCSNMYVYCRSDLKYHS